MTKTKPQQWLEQWALRYRLWSQPTYGGVDLTFKLLGHLAASNQTVKTVHLGQLRHEISQLSSDEAIQNKAQQAFSTGQLLENEAFERSLRFSKATSREQERLIHQCWRMIWADAQLGVREYQLIHLWGYWLNWSRQAIDDIGRFYQPQPLINNYYQALILLGGQTDMTATELKQLYKKQISRYHPDKWMGAHKTNDEIAGATEHIVKLQQAYAIIRFFKQF